tara:strand:+ start:1023 stop:1916 length:894 start_codon:yes stop_codon:yes gene_type:complete
LRNFLRSIAPNFLLTWFRKIKKNNLNKKLNYSKLSGDVITHNQLLSDFIKIGIKHGDHILVHSSLSKIGYVKNGPLDVINSLIESVGDNGNLLMPSSPNAFLQLDYIQSLDCFDVCNTPSALGIISEKFRSIKGVIRSEHPTEPVCCYGPLAKEYTKDHFGEITPYTDKSPFYKLAQNNGKILYLGVTLDNAGTSLHLLEDAVGKFKFPVYFPQKFKVQVKRYNGRVESMDTYVHNPEQSKKRKCNELIPMFKKYGVLKNVTVGNANCLLLDAKKMFDLMLNEYKSNGVTMYTPTGS